MLIDHTLFGDINKPEKSIALLREFEPMAIQLHPEGYYLAYSGGKDSDTCLQLCLEAGVKFSVHYNITTVDPPEAIKHIKQTRERLKKCGVNLYMQTPGKFADGTQKTMWSLIERKGPPSRVIRYCCSELKEGGGKDRLCITGVRWAESKKRKINRRAMEILTSKIKNKILFNDNAEDRRQFENCMQKGKRIINPIIDWEDIDIWDFIPDRKIIYCRLYDEGFDRIGCIGCPLGGSKSMEEEFKRYPHYKKKYLRAFDKMLQNLRRRKPNFDATARYWTSPEAVFEWWLYSTDREQEEMTNQLSFDFEEYDRFQYIG